MSTQNAVPVWMTLPRADGTRERVQVGVAVPGPGGLTLQLEQGLRLERTQEVEAPPTPAACNTVENLESLASRARRVLADPRKARWHETERKLLSAIEAELERRKRPAQRWDPSSP